MYFFVVIIFIFIPESFFSLQRQKMQASLSLCSAAKRSQCRSNDQRIDSVTLLNKLWHNKIFVKLDNQQTFASFWWLWSAFLFIEHFTCYIKRKTMEKNKGNKQGKCFTKMQDKCLDVQKDFCAKLCFWPKIMFLLHNFL